MGGGGFLRGIDNENAILRRMKQKLVIFQSFIHNSTSKIA